MLTFSSGASPGLAEKRSQYPMMPSTLADPLLDCQITAEKPAPTQLEHGPFGFFQCGKGITGVTDGIGWRRPQLGQPIRRASLLLDQHVAPAKRRIAHPVEDT